ncbi:MAG: murein biosynthesis integral membrane protein MurJ [Holosporales bacterium]|jgi:putative peptidoglycan lipid II flippase|nr:murein biosynthesis integral membrane protein MurJ [Holosporales bacterium]
MFLWAGILKDGSRKETYTMKLFRVFLTVAGWTGVSRLSGVVREIMLANVFGAGTFMDIYTFAVKLPNFFRRFFAEGALNAVLVPKFSSMMATDTKENMQTFANQMLSVLVVGLLAFVVVVEIGMPVVIGAIAPGLKDAVREQVIHYARLTFPYIWLVSIVAFISGVLNSVHRFAWAAGISVALNVAMVAALALGKLCESATATLMHMLCGSIVLGGVVQCALLWRNCNKHGVQLRMSRPTITPEVKNVLKASIPGMIGAGVVQINVFIDMAFASTLPSGGISYLAYADRLNQLPLSLLGAALGTTMLPALSRLWQSGSHEEAHRLQKRAFSGALTIAIPATVGLFLLAEPIIRLLYGHGKFDDVAIKQTAMTLQALAIGLPAHIITKINSAAFFAKRNTKTPVLIAAGCVFLNVALNAMLIGRFAHVGLASATALAAWANAIIGLRIRA